MAVVASVVYVALLALPAQAADAAADKKPAAPAGQDGSWIGQLGPSSGGGDASLKSKDDKKTYVLWAADADVKKQIGEMLKKHGNVTASGSLAADGTSIKVTSISFQEAKHKGKGQ
jgi:opacity protein-like surface antigen